MYIDKGRTRTCEKLGGGEETLAHAISLPMTDTIQTHAAQLLADNLHPHRIVLLEEYGGRDLHLTLDEAEAFEESSGYVLEDILPDFMFSEILTFLRKNNLI